MIQDLRPPLGIIAGGGSLPVRLVEACQHTKRPCFVIMIEGAPDHPEIAHVPHAKVRIGAVGDILSYLHSASVKEVVLAGAIKRPSMTSLMPDAVGAKLLARIGIKKLFAGDDALLKAVIGFLEEEGFKVVGADEVLYDLVAPEGFLTRTEPDRQAVEDILYGFQVVQAIGSLDIGQAVIIENGYVLGVEAAEGTDALIARCQLLQREKKRAILVKAKKPMQEQRVDMPSIGIDTIRRMQDAGMLGLACEAGGTLMLDRAEMVRMADQYGMFIASMENP